MAPAILSALGAPMVIPRIRGIFHFEPAANSARRVSEYRHRDRGHFITSAIEDRSHVVGYKADGKSYWVATDRFDLSAEDIALAYKMRWAIESFFAWWKRHLKVYHLIARSPYGLLMQILSGLITYLLLAIHCHEQHDERVSIQRVRQLRNKIRNEAADFPGKDPPGFFDLDSLAAATS